MLPVLSGLLRFTTLTVSLLALSGCGLFSSSEPEEKATAFAARQDILDDGLTLYEAIALNLQTRLDSRLDAPESVTGIFDDPMMQSWAILDRGIDDARAARIDDPHVMAADRKRKAAWGIIQETEMVYRRAALAQDIQSEIHAAILEAQTAADDSFLSDAEKASIQAGISDLQSLESTLSSAREQLALLLGIQYPDGMKLDSPDSSEIMSSVSESDIRDMEHLALLSRPEIQSGKRLGADDVDKLRNEALQTFPGIRGILEHREGDRPLSPEQWSNFSSGLSKSLTRIFTLPLTIEQPGVQAHLAELQQQALSAAIMAQVHLATESYEAAVNDMRKYQSLGGSPDQTIAGTLKAVASKTRTQIAAIDVQNSYSGLMNTLGVDMLPEQAGSMTLADLSFTLENRFENATPDMLDVLVARADEVQPETIVVAANQEIYQHPEIVPAAFHPVDFAMRLPLAQKIFRQENPAASIFYHFSGDKRTLKISENGIRDLLDAPITEP